MFQVAFKQMILSFMERYFYLICFSVYSIEQGPGGFNKSFVEVNIFLLNRIYAHGIIKVDDRAQ